jgi:hypothetical protein
MITSVIVETESGFRTYSGWVVNQTTEYLVLAAVGDPMHEPTVVAIPVAQIVSDRNIAA